MDLIFATNNRHKLEEIQSAAGKKIKIISLNEAGINTEIPEDFDTLEDNSRQKAFYIFERTGLDCFADDSGLEVRILQNRPGVYSARYSLMNGVEYPQMNISEANNRKLLRELEGKSDRSARFRTVITLIMKGQPYSFEGIVNGKILDSPRGNNGFGYDPIFRPEGYEKSFAEMSLSEKNQLSHRAKAVKKLISFLEKY